MRRPRASSRRELRVVVAAAWLVLVPVVLASGCSDETVSLLRAPPDLRPPGDASVPSRPPDLADDDRDRFESRDGGSDLHPSECVATMPIHLGGARADQCAASLAAANLRHVLCTCADFAPTATVTTTSIDSRGLAVDGDEGAAIGANLGISTSADLDVGGALESSAGIDIGFQSEVHETLRAGASVVATASLHVEGNGYVAGDLTGPILVDGMLHMRQGNQLTGGVVAMRVERDYSPFTDPCPCRPQDVIPIAAIVATHAGDNRNASIALDRDALRSLPGRYTLDLSCGDYYLTAIASPEAVTLAIHGHVALHVDGNINVAGGLPVVLDAGAELDLLVAGSFTAGGPIIGDPAHSARVRIWLGSALPTTLDGAPHVGALLYGPGTDVTLPSGGELSGAALANRLVTRGRLDAHFDRALLDAGSTACGTPPATAIH